jgi:hypothetical protein
MLVMHRIGESDERKELEVLRQREEIERMLERASELRLAAANHRREFEMAEKEEKRLRERVGELNRQREAVKEKKKWRDRSSWYS